MITIENKQLGDLIVTNVERYFDESGSYLDHYQAKANRTPTNDEMNDLFVNHKIVCMSS
jgi:hypothetical protein